MPQAMLTAEIFLGILFVIALLNALMPKKLWEIFGSWKAVKTPSAVFFTARQAAGIFFMLVILAIF